MELSSGTQIIMNLWTIILVWIFLRNTSAKITKFKEDIQNKTDNCKLIVDDMEERLSEHEKLDKDNNISERLARIETDIQWIRQALDKK